MGVDTSSYYPEVPDKEGGDGYSLNSRQTGLFGDESKAEEDKRNETPEGNQPDIPDNEPGQDREPIRQEKAEPDDFEDRNDLEKFFSGVAHFLSWALVPLLMPVYGLMLAFGLSVLELVPMGLRVRFTLITFGISFIIPVLLVLLLKFLGMIDDVGLNGRKERLIPYIITAICFGGTGWFMAMRGAPLWLCMFFAGGSLATLVNLCVNFKWKISAHAAAIAGVIALLVRLERNTIAQPELFVWLLITIGMTGLLGTARIWLGRHTVWQVLAGYVVGFCSVFFLMGIG